MRVLFFTAAAIAAMLGTQTEAVKIEQTVGSGMIASPGAMDTSSVHQYLSELGTTTEEEKKAEDKKKEEKPKEGADKKPDDKKKEEGKDKKPDAKKEAGDKKEGADKKEGEKKDGDKKEGGEKPKEGGDKKEEKPKDAASTTERSVTEKDGVVVETDITKTNIRATMPGNPNTNMINNIIN